MSSLPGSTCGIAFVQVKVSRYKVQPKRVRYHKYHTTTALHAAGLGRDPLPVCILRIPALSLTDCGAPKT